jgi:hypothetical protein
MEINTTNASNLRILISHSETRKVFCMRENEGERERERERISNDFI